MKKRIISCVLFFLMSFIISAQNDYKEFNKDNVLYSWVNGTRIRNIPDLKNGRKVGSLKEGESVVYTGEKSENTAGYRLRGKYFITPFVKVKYGQNKEKTGWVVAGALTLKKPLSEKQKSDLINKIKAKVERSEKLISSSVGRKNERNVTYDEFLKLNKRLNIKYNDSRDCIFYKEDGTTMDAIDIVIYKAYYSEGIYENSRGDSEIYHVFRFPENKQGIKFGMTKKKIIKIIGKPYYDGDNYISYRMASMENDFSPYESDFFIFLNGKLFAYKEVFYPSN